ncbi:toll/interleukin-1 receptor domain-containing protein, partial [candidate division KSB1 bacterium]|nr:toll/interleukin-1 receptor domain-containing protein [candidate division KSB1 bacterium]
MQDFFISYNSADEHWAEWIAWQLEEAGYSVIIQAWDFKAGENFVLEMQQAAAGCERTIAVLSTNYLNALYTQPEWAAAFAQDPTGEKRTLIPIRIQPCDLKGLQKAIIYIDLVGLKEEEAKNRLLSKIKTERAKPTIEPMFPGDRTPAKRQISKEPKYPGKKRSAINRFRLKRRSTSEVRSKLKQDGKATETMKATWIGAIALILTAIVAGLFTLTPMLCNKRIIDFELNGNHFHPNSIITIKIKGAPSIKNNDLVILLDSCPLDYCLEKKSDHWEFNPMKCNLPDELLKDGKHELSLRLANTEGDKKYIIYFDAEAPAFALEKTVESDESATFKGITADRGTLPEDTINVDILLWNGDRYERTELPVNKYVNKSGQTVWGFQANVKRIPKLEQTDPNFSETFCRIQVNDKAKNIASYELPYAQVFARGVSRTLIGDTEILMGSQ